MHLSKLFLALFLIFSVQDICAVAEKINPPAQQGNRKEAKGLAVMVVTVCGFLLTFGYVVDQAFIDCATYNQPIECGAFEGSNSGEPVKYGYLCRTPGGQRTCYNSDFATHKGPTVCARSTMALGRCKSQAARK